MSEIDDLGELNMPESNPSPAQNTTQPVYQQPKSLPNANATLVLGIISIAGCYPIVFIGLICGIIAVALHGKDKRIYATDPAAYAKSFKNAKAGFICGIIGLSLASLALIIVIIALASGEIRF